MTTDNIRAEFEKWGYDNIGGFRSDRHESGLYDNHIVEAAWKAWQASTANSNKELVKAIKANAEVGAINVELQAENQRLREALVFARQNIGEVKHPQILHVIDEALNDTKQTTVGEMTNTLTQRVAEAIHTTLPEHLQIYKPDCWIQEAKAAIEASGAKHIPALVEALKLLQNNIGDKHPFFAEVVKRTLAALPPELRGEV